MRSGDLEIAWAVSDGVLARRQASGQVCWDRPRHLQFIWNGASPAGRRVLVRCYHGLGDTIQFIRFMRPLREVARHVVVWAQPPLLDLVADTNGVDQVIALHDGSPEVEYDVDMEIMEVPHALRVGSIPNDVPYLSTPYPRRESQRGRAFQVGIAWQAGEWDERRNIPLPLLARLANVTGIRLFSLQKKFVECPGVAIAATDCETVNKTAARILELDLIISVDTMAAHLAGALAVPTWTLLHADCDWRWGRIRGKTVWYPTMRLFRQPSPGDWKGVIKSIGDALAAAFANDSTRSI